MVKASCRTQGEELLLGSTEKQYFFVVIKEIYYVCESSLADSVPEHESATSIFRHGPIFDSVIMPISLYGRIGGMRVDRPTTHVVATDLHAINNYVSVPAFGEVALHSLISAVCIAD